MALLLEGVVRIQNELSSRQPTVLAIDQVTGDTYETTANTDGTFSIQVQNQNEHIITARFTNGTYDFAADPQAFVVPNSV